MIKVSVDSKGSIELYQSQIKLGKFCFLPSSEIINSLGGSCCRISRMHQRFENVWKLVYPLN